MPNDQTEEQTQDELHASRYRQSSFAFSDNRYPYEYGDGDSYSTARKIWIAIAYACGGFGMLVLCCWWSLLMIWFNPTIQPPSSDASKKGDDAAALFKACKSGNWSGLDVFITLASLAFARVLQAPFAPPQHVWGIRLLLFSPLGVLVEMVWMWYCMIWILVTRRRPSSFFAMCSAVRMYRMRGLRPDIGVNLQREATYTREEKSNQFAQMFYEDTLNDAEKTSSRSTSFPAKIQEGNSDSPITTDLIAVSQRRYPLLTCTAYALMVFHYYKVQSVTGAGASFIKLIVSVYEIAFITTETIYLMPNPGATSIADAANAMKVFFKDISHSHSEANPFSAYIVTLLFICSAGGSYAFAVMVYGITQLFGAFAILFPEEDNIINSLALTLAIELAFKMLIIIPSVLGSLALAMALPFWIMTARRAWTALLGRRRRSALAPVLDGPVVGSWEWTFAPLHDLQSWQRLRTAMLNYSGLVLWLVLFWDLVRVRDGKLPFVQHPDLAYNCSSTVIRDADSWLFLR